MIYFLIGIGILYCIFIIFIYLLSFKIDELEQNIIKLFNKKNNQIPSIYEVTKDYLMKHDDIFNELIVLKKQDFAENTFYNKLVEKTNTYKRIHNELNFVFKVCNKHQKINKNHKYLYIRDIIVEVSAELGNKLEIYKKIVKKFNNLVVIKNITLIGLLFPISKKDSL